MITLRAGLIVGTLDILVAMLHYYIKTYNNPLVVLQYVASGFFGSSAFSGSWDMVLWGFLFHYIIAFTFTIVFFWLYCHLPAVRKMGIAVALLYGMVMWSITQFIVIPLSQIEKVAPLTVTNVTVSILILIVCIGFPLYYMAKKTYIRRH